MYYRSELSFMDDYTSELCHYGTKGMRWGVRRYQPYGTGGYTPAGKGGSSTGKKGTVTSIESRKAKKIEAAKTASSDLSHFQNAAGAKENRAAAKAKRDEAKAHKNRLNYDRKLSEKEDKERTEKIKGAKDKLDKAERVTDQVQDMNKKLSKREEKRLMKKISKMSNDELRAEIEKAEVEGQAFRERQNLEKQYINATDYQRKEPKGRAFVNEFMSTAGDLLSMASLALGIVLSVKALKG